MKVKVGLTIDEDLIKEIDGLRGMVKRSTYVEHLLRIGLEKRRRAYAATSQVKKQRKRRGKKLEGNSLQH